MAYLNRSDVRAPGFFRASGLYPSIHEIVAFGTNADVDAAEDLSVAGGTYPGFPILPAMASAETLDIVSSSTADDSAGTGARTVQVVGLDETGRLQTVTYTMDGTTEVVTTEQWFRVWYARVLTAGSGATNAGAITLANTTGGAVFATIPAGVGRSQVAAFTVPSNRTGAVTGIWAQVSNNQASGAAVEAVVALMRRPSGGVWERLIEHPMSNLHPIHRLDLAAGIRLGALDDVKLSVISTSAANMVVGGAIQASLY